ncbi:MAG: hypothetical protein EHM55_04810 [Acidobacteria bacterium]|nr:MAG: hypothetical protein EHM55_04810 [Acidobacteriota bacterium]
MRSYLISLPERLVRSILGLSAGLAREVGEVALPAAVRRSQLYQNLVDTTLRFLIEQVGEVEGVYAVGDHLPDDFLVRRTAGNAIEVLGIVAFRASPVWVLAAMADVCGMGRHLIPEIADALKAQGLLEKDAQFATVDQMLDGLERTSSRLAASVNTPPLDVPGLRNEWNAIRDEARRMKPSSLPSRETIGQLWTELKAESVRQNRSVYETSSMLALGAIRAGTLRTGQLFGAALLDHYRQTLTEIRQIGYVGYAARQLQPYVRAAASQFSPVRTTLTQRMLEKMPHRKR